MDGNLVNNFFYSSEPDFATRGRFNPFLFKGTVFSSGGYSALYGQALSSVLLLESIDLPEKTSADFGISYLAANAGIQKLSKNKKSSWGVLITIQICGLFIISLKQKLIISKFLYITKEMPISELKHRTGMIKYYGYFSTNKTGFRNHDIDSFVLKDAFGLKNLYMYHNLSGMKILVMAGN